MLKRILTGITLGALACLAVFKLNGFYFYAFMALITCLGAWEWSSFANFNTTIFKWLFVFMIAAATWLSLYIPPDYLILVGLFYMLWMSIAVVLYSKGYSPLGFDLAGIRVLSGLMFLVSGFVAFSVIHTHFAYGAAWVFLMMLIIVGADSGAYFAGKFFGKHSMCPRVSPNKTWEGLCGGMLLGLMIGIVGSFCFHIGIKQRVMFWLLSLAAVLFSVIGDLSISMFKRQHNVKDTGNLFPGHGGMLDRMDSMYAGFIIFAVGFLWL